jgi:hypothetical protein
MKRSTFRTPLTFLMLVAAAITAVGVPSSHAQTEARTYDVELVIFRHLGPGGTPEQLNAITATDVHEGEAPAADASEVSYPKLPPQRLKLSGSFDAMRRNRAYQPLAHLAWSQPAFDRANAKFVNLATLGAGTELQGRVALTRGRYLHLTLHVTLQVPGEEARHTIKHTRRMRSGERHYIDHPRFGILAVITPSPPS